MHYQERVAVIWIEKVKSMGACTLDGVERRSGCAQDRVITTDVSNVGMLKGVNMTMSKPPAKEISSDIRTSRDRNGNRRGMIRVVRHTLGRRDSCQW